MFCLVLVNLNYRIHKKGLKNWKIQLKIGSVMNNTEMVTNFVVKK